MKRQATAQAGKPLVGEFAGEVFAAETVDFVFEAFYADKALFVDFVDVVVRHVGLDARGVADKLLLKGLQAGLVEVRVADFAVGPGLEVVERAEWADILVLAPVGKCAEEPSSGFPVTRSMRARVRRA